MESGNGDSRALLPHSLKGHRRVGGWAGAALQLLRWLMAAGRRVDSRLQVLLVCAAMAVVVFYLATVVVPTVHSLTHPPSTSPLDGLLHLHTLNSSSPSHGRRKRQRPLLPSTPPAAPHSRPPAATPPPLVDDARSGSDEQADVRMVAETVEEKEQPPLPPSPAVQLRPPVEARLLDWFAPFVLHPGLLTAVPAPYGYSVDDVSALFELQYVQAGIPRRPSDGLKVVLLLMARNAAEWLLFFLEHHLDVVDAFVVLDDASDDGTAALLHRYGPQMKVEVWMHKRDWGPLNEWPDRNLLVQAARQVQATHWLMMDVDELLSYNCAKRRQRDGGGRKGADGFDEPLLSSAIRRLNATAELLHLEEVELWGNAHQQRLGAHFNGSRHFALFDQFSALHPVPAPLHTKAAAGEGESAFTFTDPWPPSSLHPQSLYSFPPYITRGRSLPNGGSAHVGRIPEAVWQHAQVEGDTSAEGKVGPVSVNVTGGLLSSCRLVHHRFVNDFQFVFKGAFDESRGMRLAVEELRAKGQWKASDHLPLAGHSLAELTQKASAAMGEVYQSRSSNGTGEDAVVLTSVSADEWLGPSFLSLLPLFMELKPWRLLAMLRTVDELGVELFSGCRFMSRIQWRGIDRAEVEVAQQPIYSLPLIKPLPSKGGRGGNSTADGRQQPRP